MFVTSYPGRDSNSHGGLPPRDFKYSGRSPVEQNLPVSADPTFGSSVSLRGSPPITGYTTHTSPHTTQADCAMRNPQSARSNPE